MLDGCVGFFSVDSFKVIGLLLRRGGGTHVFKTVDDTSLSLSGLVASRRSCINWVAGESGGVGVLDCSIPRGSISGNSDPNGPDGCGVFILFLVCTGVLARFGEGSLGGSKRGMLSNTGSGVCGARSGED